MRFLLLALLPVTLWAQSTPDDLESEIVLNESQVEQPAFIKFDARGRLWVAEYRSYPEPAGAKMKSRDRYWRAVYDKLPSPPGHPDYHPGKDRITIHEDTNGDGQFDQHSTFLDHLNLATSFEFGPDGVYVLQPPYLLYYADKNHDDKPDGTPKVLLEGFGIEDTHSLASALTWGPDGWLYGAQGSTVSSKIKTPGSDQASVDRIGQLMWRYHPVRKAYEVFAEGGGNLWSCEFDSKGRLFSGHNGSTPGSYYLPGAYYAKTFQKHGEFSNPHVYGHLPSIDHPGWKRLSTNIAIYEGGQLPERFEGALLWANPLQHKVGASTLTPKDLNFRSEYLDPLLVGDAPLFRPVYLEPGPDGALYVADWRDTNINHIKNHEGEINKSDGRVYRIRKKNAENHDSIDFRKLTTHQLVEKLRSSNRWTRETARRILWSRPDRNELLQPLLTSAKPQDILEALWVVDRSDPSFYQVSARTLEHKDPHIQTWSARLLFDSHQGHWLAFYPRSYPTPELRSQILAGLKSHPPLGFWGFLHHLLQNEADSPSLQLRQLYWWTLEFRAIWQPKEAVKIVTSATTTLHQELAAKLARRFISENSPETAQACLALFQQSPKSLHLALTASLSQALTPDSIIPDELAKLLIESGNNSIALRIRLQEDEALSEGISLLANPKASSSALLEIIPVIRSPEAEPLLLNLTNNKDSEIARAALNSLFSYSSRSTGEALVKKFNNLPRDLQELAALLLTSRPEWATTWLEAIRLGDISSSHLTPLIRENLPESLRKDLPADSQDDFEKEISRITEVLKTTSGNPQAGRKLYLERCGACHHLYNEGGNIGPDLTSYQRNSIPDLLFAIVNPAAEIRQGFETVIVTTKNKQTRSGFRIAENDQSITIRPLGGANQIINRSEIISLKNSNTSLMPAGLISDLNEQQLRDLFTYLGTSQPLNLKK
ncbi:c-type cytochrome [Akkermansiaceae bacterium]|nr:c-type cytochrome [Akkermansiaceae bacterium]MDB4544333.1 c-type cytochrome [Akkermansiaceae bacterium]